MFSIFFQFPDFVVFLRLFHKKRVLTTKSWIWDRFGRPLFYSFYMGERQESLSPLPSNLKRISRSSSTLCACAFFAIPPLNNPQRTQKWNSLSTIHSEAMSAKLHAKCHKACSYVHLFLPKSKDMYKLGNRCGAKWTAFSRPLVRCGCKGTLL